MSRRNSVVPGLKLVRKPAVMSPTITCTPSLPHGNKADTILRSLGDNAKAIANFNDTSDPSKTKERTSSVTKNFFAHTAVATPARSNSTQQYGNLIPLSHSLLQLVLYNRVQHPSVPHFETDRKIPDKTSYVSNLAISY